MNSELRSTAALPPVLWTPAFVRVTFAHLAFGIGGAFGLHLPGMLKELGIQGKQDLGRLMKTVMAQHKGRVDGKLVQKIANELIS